MKEDALSAVYELLSGSWPDFAFKRSKKTWVKQTQDRALLMVHCQRSRWGAIYYLNFGIYYLDLQPVDKPLFNLPKLIDWHLCSRYESFEKISTADQNVLFSLEAADQATLGKRSSHIASFCLEHIFPALEIFGNVGLLGSRLGRSGESAFEPFKTQGVAKKDIVNYVQGGQKSDT